MHTVFGRIFLILILIPLVELVLLNQLYQGTNILVTVFVVLITGIVGLNLARRQGMQAWKNIHLEMSSERTPSKEILNGVMILLAGTFLITPGLLTDGVGFALLVPQLRLKLGVKLMHWFREKTVTTFQAAAWPNGVPDSEPVPNDHATGAEQPGVRVVEPDDVSN